ncbi:TraB/GumN family protein [Novosphingobium sp. TH158]|uniref:TraB/GumN family protein n=1 Tax=Novosphingobium sp. TH158 TaxID=2067455 RepID=UPI000C7A8BED|nr:TraB/GumN family protein [Novosphingobium sp. TH158]PLK25933.1 TraB/GumN family protein [Novosphingobium sp. TH158]
MRQLLAALALLLLAACARPDPARPAMWEVTGPGGEHGWLFGTIHLLPREADWRSRDIDQALAGADLLVLEIARIEDEAELGAVFTELGRTPGQLPLSQRIDPALRPSLEKLYAETKAQDSTFAELETWAAALTLAQLANKQGNSDHGIDLAIARAASHLPRAELEGARNQLSIFDRLPEKEQRDLLNLALRDDRGAADEAQLAEAWRKGDMALIGRETRTGILADPELRKALYSGRNAAWIGQIEDLMRKGRRPFVAVGAAHLAGDEGLPILLEKRGWKVVRVQ